MKRLEGKIAVVTGASSGFGRAIALSFAREGAKVVCADLNREQSQGEEIPEPTDQVINDSGGEAVYLKCDVAKASEVKALVEAAIENYGRLDIMVNNAGIHRGGNLMHTLTEEDLDDCYKVNTKGTWNGCQQALIQFLKQEAGGKIINVISSAGLGPYPAQAPYNITKAANGNLTKSLALEYGQYKINVNGICPTYCITPMSTPIWSNEPLKKMIEERIPLGRLGEVQDVADLALFLASNESNYITGVLIPLDGGETLSGFYPRDFGC